MLDWTLVLLFPSMDNTNEPQCLARNELSDFSMLCSTALCSKSMETQHVDRNHSTEV